MRMIWNAGAAAAITAMLSLATLVDASPSRSGAAVSVESLADLSSRDALQNRFELANTSQDGRLTFEQARAADWVSVARQFTSIDIAHAGFVTAEQVRAFFQAHPRRGKTEDV